VNDSTTATIDPAADARPRLELAHCGENPTFHACAERMHDAQRRPGVGED
jgi:hypothetical protein